MDKLDKVKRSELMSKVHSKGNKSTELKVELALIEAGISGWTKQPKDILGTPDFFFPDLRLVVFVDGCFWHACPVCKRSKSATSSEFWEAKFERNRKRDNRYHRLLRKQGYHVMRIWEHELKKGKTTWFRRLESIINKIERAASDKSS